MKRPVGQKIFSAVSVVLTAVLLAAPSCSRRPAETENIAQGIRYGQQGQYDLALRELTRALALNPQSAQAYYNRGLVYEQLGRDDEALADYARAIERDARGAGAFNNRANLYLRQGKFNEALADYAQVIALNPDDAIAYGNRALVYKMQGDQEKALADADAAVRLNPQQARYYDLRGGLYLMAGRLEEALQDLHQAAALEPDNGEIVFHRGLIFARLGQRESAAHDFEIAAGMDPKLKEPVGRMLAALQASGQDAVSAHLQPIVTPGRYPGEDDTIVFQGGTITLQAPAGWEKRKNVAYGPGAVALLEYRRSERPLPVIGVTLDTPPEGTADVQAYSQFIKDLMIRQSAGRLDISGPQAQTVNGLPAAYLEQTDLQGGGKSAWYQIWVGGKVLSLQYIQTADEFEDDRPAMDTVVDHLRYTP